MFQSLYANPSRAVAPFVTIAPKVVAQSARSTLRRVMALVAVLAVMKAPLAFAAWELDSERSTIQFMSVKNASIAELHHFKALAGAINDDGQAQVVIDLESVETLIPIRNERMRELLFETVRFPAATLSVVAPADVQALEAGQTLTADLAVSVDLHGAIKPYPAKVTATRLADGSLQVSLAEPIVVNASDFGLEDGVEVLRGVAGLKSISTAVPVTATLVFVETDR